MTLPLKIDDVFGQLTVREIISQGPGKCRAVVCLCTCGEIYRTDARRLHRGVTWRCQYCSAPAKIYPGVTRQRYRTYVRGAKRRGYSWNLSWEQFEVLWHAACHYCGQEPSRGVDRKNNSVGYEPENCVSCCKDCNLAKRDMTETGFLDWIARIAAFQGLTL